MFDFKKICISNNPGSKYNYQQQLIDDENYKNVKYGLVNIMARTGSGKTMIMPKSHDIDKKYAHTILFVPNTEKNLMEQHIETMRSYYAGTNQKCYNINMISHDPELSKLHKQYLDNNENEKIISLHKELHKWSNDIKTFIIVKTDELSKTTDVTYKTVASFIPNDKPINFLTNFDNHAIYIDEAHMVQTQFGLYHATNKHTYGNNKISDIKNAMKKDPSLFENLRNIALKNKLVFMSATLDDIMINEIIPYINTINIYNIYVKHQHTDYPDIDMYYLDDNKSMISHIKKAYETGSKSVIYVANTKSIHTWRNDLSSFVNKDDIYHWSYENATAFSLTHFKQAKICILINKGNTGLDDPSIENIFIDRKLSDASSSCRDKKFIKNNMSNLKHQIIGRLRRDGNVYLIRQPRQPIQDTLFNATEDNYDVLDKKNYNHLISYYINEYYCKNNNNLKDSFETYFARAFALKYIMVWSASPSSSKSSFIRIIRYHLLIQSFDRSRRSVNMREVLKGNNIEEYIKLENTVIKVFTEIFNMDNLFKEKPNSISSGNKTKSTNATDDCTGNTVVNTSKSNTNTTGGTISKTNISDSERNKGIEYLMRAIKDAGLKGNSLLAEYDSNYDEPYSGKYMHSYAKKDLDSVERTKSKYAIPMTTDAIDIKTNDIDIDDENRLMPWVDGIGITVDYDLLKQKLGRAGKDLRSMTHINEILIKYNILHGNLVTY